MTQRPFQSHPDNPGNAGNDGTIRQAIWQRYGGDDWAAFDALPPRVRQRIREHAYDAWAVNALLLWRRFRRSHVDAARAERALLRYLDHCERLERRAFSEAWRARWGTPFPHDAAGVGVLRGTAPGGTTPGGQDPDDGALPTRKPPRRRGAGRDRRRGRTARRS